MSKIGKMLILGRGGQLGGALTSILGAQADSIDRDEADFTRPESLTTVLDKFRPTVVINAAAYTQVDQAEKEVELARLINAEAPGVMARWCAKNRVPFVHYSTDYVFPGTGTRAWTEEDAVEPLNAYGKTKLEGERQVTSAGGDHLIFRTSWVYDATGENFVSTMLRLGREHEELKVVSDQRGAPTYARDLAQATLDSLRNLRGKAFASGIYHLCNRGETSWHEFAEEIFSIARARRLELKVRKVEAIPSSAFPTPAKRPQNSRMSMEKARTRLGIVMPEWQESLKKCMGQIKK